MSTSMPDSPHVASGPSAPAGQSVRIITPQVASGDGAGADAAGALAAGTIVAERYRVIEMLGEGGMGAVYRAEHIHMRKQMALKVLHASMSGTEEVVARFEREAIAAGHITHPNVAAASDFGKLPDGSFFLVLELVDGKSLRKLLTELQAEHTRIEPMRAVRIVHQIAAALGAAHAKGVVHRDLKPENVMLIDRVDDGGTTRDFVKVLDFGIAKVDVEAVSGNVRASGSGAASQPLTRIGAVFGTPDYMSPEQAMGQPVDARSDLYSIGIIFYELLTGDRPFQGGAVTVLRQHVLGDVPPLPLEVVAQLDPRIVSVLGRLLTKTPDARLATADELHATLGDVIARPEIPPPGVLDPQQQPIGTMPTMMAGMPGISMAGMPGISMAGMPGISMAGMPSISTDGTAMAGLPAVHSPAAPARNQSDARRPAWALIAGLAVAATLGLLLVGFVLHRVLSTPDVDATNPTSSSSSKATSAAPIDLPPPPSSVATPTGTATATAGAGAGAGADDDDRAAGGGGGAGRTSKDSKDGVKGGAGKPKGRKTGPFGIYIPPPKEW
jgi:eukaryotic-like serine/threonine-protein kinase